MALKKMLLVVILLVFAAGVLASREFATIASGIAIFLVGMFSMEDGFRLFTGGVLSKILRKTTDTVFKAIVSGFTATAFVQSSSLVTVITISFLSAELIALSHAVGIIFGANIGTTATAWIVAAFGMKIKIAEFALPMIIFGVLFSFFSAKTYKGVGNILLGLGFIFLGISFMKEGFETLQSYLDLSRFVVEGYLGIAVYILLGIVATVIIQSSSATMALIITAVATGQINYINSLSLAIGANLGTTVTAIIGAVTSNANGKRLAVAHVIFNVATALFAVVFINQLAFLVDFISVKTGIGDQDAAIKLSLFHSIFNIAGVVLVTPFIGRLVTFLKTLFVAEKERRKKTRYLDDEVVKTAGPAIAALYRETESLLESVLEVIVQALRLHRHQVFSVLRMDEVVKTIRGEGVDVDLLYRQDIKFLYSDILRYCAMAESNMEKPLREKVYRIKLASRELIEAIKDIRELQKNIVYYMGRNNKYIKNEYNFLRRNLAELIRTITNFQKNGDGQGGVATLEAARERNARLDMVSARRLSALLREGKIDDNMASSLMNDGAYASRIAMNLIRAADILRGEGRLALDQHHSPLKLQPPHHTPLTQ
ncbi:Na/Pi cotransporter family protein [Desulforhopalus singaporensis]|uniref:Phosphate:Na+ symporter n=1 Tax=Desulforhopalus singaporensis TaxID=91360 RepID=A0A1H0PC55_9BACT|nr:Na/Pi symporter [Desulforhopalus singaporensis]SDP02593.1 phosphate:Na+ symporter [Desulforhopalus singaporensis]